MHEEAESAGSSKRREVDDRLTSANDPPPYGAQHRQDALWKGGNEALPPRWQQFELGGDTGYQDDELVMASWKRPLPGVRLDQPGNLVVSECEWHISPHGRSYFVNHNTRTTSWKKPMPDCPSGSLTPECIFTGHSKAVWNLACLGTSYKVMSASADGSIRQWRINGELVGEPWRSDGRGVGSMALSPDATMVVSGSTDGRLRLWNVEEGNILGEPWQGHNAPARCLGWAPNAREIASGSQDGTIRRWNPHNGQQTAPPIETGHGRVDVIKYSSDGDKLASGGTDYMIRVWSNDGKLLIEIKGHDGWVRSLCWSKDGTHIFSGSSDNTIRKWRSIDGKEVFILRGHTKAVRSLCFSPDERHLVSASADYSVRIWDLNTNQPVGNPLLHDDELRDLAMTSDGRYIATAGLDKKIYLWSIEGALKQNDDQPDAKLKGHATSPRELFDSSPRSKQQVRNQGLSRYGDAFWGNDTNCTLRNTHSPSPSPPRWRNFFNALRFSPRYVMPPNATQSRRTPAPITKSSTTTLFAITSPLRILSNWWPIRTGDALPPVVDVPLTKGDQRNATAGAPKGNGGYRRDEEFDSRPPSPTRNPNSQQLEPSAVAKTTTGNHGGGRWCFCL